MILLESQQVERKRILLGFNSSRSLTIMAGNALYALSKSIASFTMCGNRKITGFARVMASSYSVPNLILE
jgi:hypothetical protein